MGDVLKGIGSVAPAVGSMFGPVGTAVGAGVGALASGISSDKKAGQYEGQINGIAQNQVNGFNTYYAPLLDAYARSIGYNPSTGSFDGYNANATGTTDNSAQIKQLQAQRDALAKQISGYDKTARTPVTSAGSAANTSQQYASQQLVKGNKQIADLDAQIKQLQGQGDRTPTTPNSSTSNTVKPYGETSATPYGAVSSQPYGAASQTPYGAVDANPYGDASENSYMGNYGTQRYNQAANAIDKASDQAVAQIGADALARGFTGHNTASTGQIANARVAEGQNLANTKAGLMQAGEDERYRRTVANSDAAWGRNAQNVNMNYQQTMNNSNAAWDRNVQNVNTAWQQNAANVDEQNRRMAQFLQMLSGNANNALGTLSGLGGKYASQSGAMGDGLGSLLGLITNSGATGVGSKIKIGTPPIAPTSNYAPQGSYNIASWKDYGNLA